MRLVLLQDKDAGKEPSRINSRRVEEIYEENFRLFSETGKMPALAIGPGRRTFWISE